MNDNVKETKNTGMTEEERKEYYGTFIPNVHKVGRATMAIAFILAFLPVVYFVVVKGFAAPMSSYISVTIAICSISFGMWLTEPLAFWPVLGSAGTYIGYFSGNAGGMRFPVAMSLQTSLKADINTPRGQIVTIAGIVSSVIVNIVILLIVVFSGAWLLKVLPDPVMASFAFVMPGLFGALFIMKADGQDGIGKGFMNLLPYIVIAIVIKFLEGKAQWFSAWGLAITVAISIVVAYWLYKNESKKEKAA